jgi:teichuronic acid biosynthesis glycosyltransferase TuaG
MDIAVIIPTYNRALSLKRAIDSVQAQTAGPTEIIVVDDGSEEDIPTVVRPYGNCRYRRIEHSGLPAVVRNAGLAMTSADYVAFLDSDDEWLPHKLERQLRSNCEFVCSNASLVLNDGSARRPYLPLGQKHVGRVLGDLLKDNFVITSSVIVRRDLVKRAGGFSEDPRLRGIEDYDLWLRVAAITDFCYVDEELLLYEHSVASLSRTQSMRAQRRGLARIFSRAATRALVRGQYREFVTAGKQYVVSMVLAYT